MANDCETVGSDERSVGEGGGAGGGGNGGGDARERHKLAERVRRKSMRELFISLHTFLPNANKIRKEQSAILDEIIKYIPIAAAHLRSFQNRKHSQNMNSSSLHNNSNSSSFSSLPSIQISDRGNNSIDCDIRVAPEPSSSISIRIRGNQVNVSLTDTKGTSQKLLLSAILDELEAHQLELLRSAHCLDGSKVLHHYECKVCDGLDKSPVLLKTRLQELATKLHKLRKSSSLKRSYDQIDD